MTRRMIFPLLLGVVGTVVLILLGTWQLQRLAEKQAIIARIETRLLADPVPFQGIPDPAGDRYRRVQVSGEFDGPELHVLTSVDGFGPGFRVIAPLRLADGRRILVDRGFITEAEKSGSQSTGAVAITGSLHWPQETDSFTPEPNLERNIWFARNVEKMALALNTEPVMVVVAQSSQTGGPRPQPVTVNIPNRHLEYVITWYLLAVVWIGMTGYLLWRIKRQTV